MRKEGAAIDRWSKELAPSTELRKWFDHRSERFTEFGRLYRDELAINPAVASTLAYIGDGRATLLYGARDPAVNHAVVLADYLKLAASGGPVRGDDRPKGTGK